MDFIFQPHCDVSEIISQRLNAMRKLQDNPNDVEASKILYETQQNVNYSNKLPKLCSLMIQFYRCLLGQPQKLHLDNFSEVQKLECFLKRNFRLETKHGLRKIN